jgi:hypothetical protein
VNIGASTVVLRPRTLAEVLDLAFRFSVSVAAGLYARLAAALLLPVYAGCLALHYALGWGWAPVWYLAVVLGSVAQGVFTVAAGRLLFSEELGAWQAIRLFARRLGSYSVMLLLTRSTLTVISLALVLSLDPGQTVGAHVPILLGLAVAWPRIVFTHEASLLEGAGPVEAIRRSNRFISGRGASAFAVLMALLLTQGAFVITFELLCQGLVDEVLQLGKPFGALLSDGGSPYALAGLLLSIPYVSTARFLDYIDARTRSDGWDIQLQFMAIAARDSEGREAA